MRSDLINEDSNQFGPGTDLIICLLALLMVFVTIVSYLYGNEKKSNSLEKSRIGELTNTVRELEASVKAYKEKSDALEKHGEFKPAGEFLVAGTFKQNPYYELLNPEATETEIQNIVRKYKDSSSEYPYIFVIGHANTDGLAGKPNLPYEERLKYNWEFAGARSVVIANLIQRHLSDEEKNKLIIVSTGEFDLKIPERPTAPENAFVEVFFANEWQPQSYKNVK